MSKLVNETNEWWMVWGRNVLVVGSYPLISPGLLNARLSVVGMWKRSKRLIWSFSCGTRDLVKE